MTGVPPSFQHPGPPPVRPELPDGAPVPEAPREGEPPRPAQEPEGYEGSSNSGETAVGPATGTPNP